MHRTAKSQKTGRRKKRSGFGWRKTFKRYWWLFLFGGIVVVGGYVFLFYYFFVGPFSFRWKAIYRNPIYPEGYDVRGIDISHYQKDIQWERLRNETLNDDPIRFVFIKATEGEKLLDEDFNENFYQAGENGFIRGAYHFYVPGVDIRKQAKHYLHMVHLVPGDLPPVLDVENRGNLSNQEIKEDVRTWLEIVGEKYGVRPIIYTGYKFRTDILNDAFFDDYPLWIAHYYINKMEYKGKWAFWQHTDCGRLSSIPGFVDCNIFNGTPEELQDLTIKE